MIKHLSTNQHDFFNTSTPENTGTIFVFACECIIGLFESDIMYVIMKE